VDVEIRLLSDPEYAKEFDVAVEQIIDRYVAGEFHGADLDRVRSYFLKSEQRQEKLRFALALKERKAKRSSGEVRQKSNFTRYLAIAASLVAVIGIGFFAWRASRSTNDLQDGLVALQTAFREQRPIEGRLSDFNYVPKQNQRGASATVDYVNRDLAAALLLRERSDHPSAASHQAVGKYYLMVGQFEQARKELEAALALEPNNAKIHNDLGAVFLEECPIQATGANGVQLEVCGRSLEHVEKALALDNTLLEALFNRALLFQALKSRTQAIAAWWDYLAKDSSSQWAQEAQRNLKYLEQAQPVSHVPEDSFDYERADDEAGKTFVEYRLAHCYVLLPDPEKARLAFSRLLAVTD
jgi:tetratricopeptide (TPR) repeat protein